MTLKKSLLRLITNPLKKIPKLIEIQKRKCNVVKLSRACKFHENPTL